MPHILIVEDSEDLRYIIKDILQQAGHTISEACDGTEVAKFLQEDNIDLVITDIIMPEQEGIQTILEIRRKNTDIKIIGISGGGLGGAEHYLEMAREFGANATLQKPFQKAQLLELVNTLLKPK